MLLLHLNMIQYVNDGSNLFKNQLKYGILKWIACNSWNSFMFFFLTFSGIWLSGLPLLSYYITSQFEFTFLIYYQFDDLLISFQNTKFFVRQRWSGNLLVFSEVSLFH